MNTALECSTCGRQQPEVKVLLQIPTGVVCDECIATMIEILNERAAKECVAGLGVAAEEGACTMQAYLEGWMLGALPWVRNPSQVASDGMAERISRQQGFDDGRSAFAEAGRRRYPPSQDGK